MNFRISMFPFPKNKKKTLKWWIVFGTFAMGTCTGLFWWMALVVIPEGHGEIDIFMGMPLYLSYILSAVCSILGGWVFGCLWGALMYYVWQGGSLGAGGNKGDGILGTCTDLEASEKVDGYGD
jgi:hypothetical protein